MSAPGMRRLSGTVLALGATAFFTDVGAHMIFPLLPVFLTETLGASPGYLGLVEGVADAASSALKLGTGVVADRLPRRQPVVAFGYGLAAAVRPLMALATAPWHVFAVRVVDRIGKGIRTAPRDALVADVTAAADTGRAFGFHGAMDHAGAVVGPLVASALVAGGMGMRRVFWLAGIPGAIAVVLVLAIREPEPPAARAPALARGARLPTGLRAFLAIVFLFALGNASDAFLLLRARELGVSAAAIPTLWTLVHVGRLLSSYVGGALADRLGRATVVGAGWLVHATVYVGLGTALAGATVWPLFALYGLHHGFTDPPSKALVRDLAPAPVRARAFGAYNFIVGMTALPASLLAGWLWETIGARTTLMAYALIVTIATASLAVWGVTHARSGTV